MKVAIISRHELLPSQQLAIKEALNPTETIQVANYEGIEQLEAWKQQGVDAVVLTTLPPRLMSEICSKFTTYLLKMESSAIFTNEAEAQAWKAEQPDRRTLLPSPEGTYRGLQFAGLFKVVVLTREEAVWLPE